MGSCRRKKKKSQKHQTISCTFFAKAISYFLFTYSVAFCSKIKYSTKFLTIGLIGNISILMQINTCLSFTKPFNYYKGEGEGKGKGVSQNPMILKKV